MKINFFLRKWCFMAWILFTFLKIFRPEDRLVLKSTVWTSVGWEEQRFEEVPESVTDLPHQDAHMGQHSWLWGVWRSVAPAQSCGYQDGCSQRAGTDLLQLAITQCTCPCTVLSAEEGNTCNTAVSA